MHLNSKHHGLIDYLLVIFLWMAPGLFNFSGSYSLFLYILGGIHLLMTLSTSFECGITRIIPLKIHGNIELGVSIMLAVASLFIFRHEGGFPAIFLLTLGGGLFFVWLITDYSCKPAAR